MQVELFKLEDVKFSNFKPQAFQKYFAFYGLIRTDTAMLLRDLLILLIRHTHSDIQIAVLGHAPMLVPDCTATVWQMDSNFFWGVSGVLSNRNPLQIKNFMGFPQNGPETQGF
jgi:hypothetical protein